MQERRTNPSFSADEPTRQRGGVWRGQTPRDWQELPVADITFPGFEDRFQLFRAVGSWSSQFRRETPGTLTWFPLYSQIF